MANPNIENIDNRTLAMGNNKYRQEILLSGVVVKGEVLGFISASQKLIATIAAAIDGSEVARVIAAEAKDASGGEKPITVLIEGDVDDSLLTFNAAETLDTVPTGQEDSMGQLLRGVGILANTYPNVLVKDNQ